MARNRRTDHGQVAPTEEIAHDARSVAATVLARVTDDGAYASRALDAELQRTDLDPRDAALSTEIVYGALRVLPALDRIIAERLTRADGRIDPLARATLRSATYQLWHLSRLPTHAIVDESVRSVRARRGPKLAGFVNAVLRKLAQARPAEPAPPRALVLPEWTERLLERALGPERLARFLEQHALAPALCLRAESARDALLAQLSAAAPHASTGATALSPLGVWVRRAGSPRGLPGYADGAFSVQEEGAQLLGLALGAQPGERIADVCAGHGGKTTLLARQVGETGRLFALDKDERKLKQIPRECKRIGLDAVPLEWLAVDLSVGTGGLEGGLDRVLVDAPCTGLGTVHRRPELLLRLSPDDPARMAELQRAILRNAATLVRPGGVLAYAVCSPTREEGQDVVDAFGTEHPTYRLVHQALSPWLPPPDANGVLQIGPWLVPPGASSAPDAYQLVVWRREG